MIDNSQMPSSELPVLMQQSSDGIEQSRSTGAGSLKDTRTRPDLAKQTQPQVAGQFSHHISSVTTSVWLNLASRPLAQRQWRDVVEGDVILERQIDKLDLMWLML